MEEDIKILEELRDNIYGNMDYEDDYQVFKKLEKEFNALNLAIKSLKALKDLKSKLTN